MVKILHTGDIHLDGPFTLEDASASEARRAELRATFCAVTEYIRQNGVQLCLIAGDMFDSEYAAPATIETVVSEFARSPGCVFVITPGNHDSHVPSGVWANTEFPANVHVFCRAECERLELPELGCDVYGYAFTGPFLERNPVLGVRPADPSRINILCAHADTASPISKYCPITEGDIAESGFDYVALAHIHNSDGLHRAGNTVYAYCGCLEGRDYSESGYKGAVVGTISKLDGAATVSLAGKRFSRRRYADERLNVTGAADAAEAAAALGELISEKKFADDTLLRVTLEGSVTPAFRVSAADFASVTTGLYSFDLVDRTVPLFDADRLKNDNTLRGAYFRRLLPTLQNGTQEEREIASAALRYGMGALDGADVIDF